MKTLAWIPLVVVAAGCAPVRYTVLQQAQPNPVTPARRFVLEPLQMQALTVDRVPEQAWRTSRTPYQNAEFDADRRDVYERFGARLQDRATRAGLQLTNDPQDPGAITVRPILRGVTFGLFTFYYDLPTRADLVLQLIDSEGRLIDEVTLDTGAKGVTFTTRLEKVADKLADGVVRYLQKRQHTGA
jgi:hypothetical protein